MWRYCCWSSVWSSVRIITTFGRLTVIETLAFLYYYSKKYGKAWSLISKLLADSGSDPELRFYGGLSLAALDSTTAARREFEMVLKFRGDSAEAWQQLCYVAIKEKNLDLALSTVDTFTASMPRSGDAWRMKGYVLNARKEYTRAAASLQKAIALDSGDAPAWFELGMSFERSNKKEDAAQAFKRVLTLRPGDPPAANYLAYMWADQGIKLDSARMLLSLALKKDSANGAYLDSYAWIFYKMGSIDTANMYIVKALGRITDDPVVYSHYADILVKMGDYSGALTAYRKGLACAIPEKATPEEIADLKKKISDMEHMPARSPKPERK